MDSLRKTISAATIIGAISLTAFAASADELLPGYIALEDYVAQHQGERARSEAFAEVVRSEARPLGTHQDKPVRIFIVYPGLQVSDYWKRSVTSFEGRMRDLGIDYVVEHHFTKPGTQLRLQSNLINEALSDPPDYMIFTLDALRHLGMIERIMARSTTKVILQNITTPIEALEGNQAFLYVGFDHGIGARMIADHYRKLKPQGAKYAILFGPQGYVSTFRGGVFLSEMNRHPGYQLLASYYVNFDRQRAYDATKEILAAHEDIDFIYACSTDIALGVVDALKEAGRQDVLVNGWGGGAAELEAIEMGDLDFTVMRMNDDNGVAMAEAIKFDLAGEANTRVPTVYSGGFRLVDSTMSRQELAKLRDYAFRYSR